MNKNERKSQNSVALFKIEAYSKYLQDVASNYLCPMPLYIWWFDIFQKGIGSKIYW